jgi:exodeoxyribonuclease VII large subunit
MFASARSQKQNVHVKEFPLMSSSAKTFPTESLDSSALLAQLGDGDNAPPLSVSELSGALKRVVEDRFGYVRVRGEISGFKRAASGHVYLALKDDRAVIDGVMWKGTSSRLAFAAEDGIEVIATGKLTTYPGRSKYQIVIEQMELAGEGALMQLFERLRAKLLAEGLFDAQRKRPLPLLPRTIGIVTSPTGSVIRDILHRLADRCPSHVIVWPVLVQGDKAAEQIAAAVRGFSNLPENGPVPRPDLLIVARGGGSIEDLWSFNEEITVRAIAESTIPVISAVGHETDTTLADFAADVRAPTPTAAAEMAVPVRAELLAMLNDSGTRLQRSVQNRLSLAKERVEAQRRLMPAFGDLLRPQQQRLDEQGERLRLMAERAIGRWQGRLAQSSGALRPALIQRRWHMAADRLAAVRIQPDMLTRRLQEAQQRLAQGWRLAENLHPDRPLKFGYARVSASDGTVVTSTVAAAKARLLTLHFADGTIDARTGADGGDMDAISRSKAATRNKKPADHRQEQLF